MSAVEPEDQEDKPLDPAMENVRRKMVKLQLASGGVMLLMLMAVLATIVYKVTQGKPAAPAVAGQGLVPSDAPVSAVAALPVGFTIESVSLANGQLLFWGRTTDGERKAIVYDIAAGRVVADVRVTTN